MPESRLNPRVVAAASTAAVADEMRRLGADPRAAGRMAPRAEGLAVALQRIDARAAAVLKQEMLGAGGDLALSREAWAGEAAETGALLVGDRRAFDTLLVGLEGMPLGLPEIGRAVAACLDAWDRQAFTLDAAGRTLALGDEPVLMGVVNVTPDSFSDGGRFLDPGAAVEHGLRLAAEGAAVLDVGGESTRPGSDPVPVEEELERVLPVVEGLAGRTEALVSIDTRRARVARAALEAGASIVNDVSALGDDPDMARACADAGAAVVLMHMQGTPRTMQQDPAYGHLMAEICGFLREAVERAALAGVDADRVLVDPGIGFGKTLEHNVEIFARLAELRSLGRPIVVGPSRKRFIGALTGVGQADERVLGTAAACCAAVAAGAHVLRVHDVAAVREAVRVAAAIARAQRKGS